MSYSMCKISLKASLSIAHRALQAELIGLKQHLYFADIYTVPIGKEKMNVMVFASIILFMTIIFNTEIFIFE